MKYVKYILIIIILVGFFSPIVQVSAQTSSTANWYIEYKPNSGGSDVILGPYSNTGCQNVSVYGLGTLVKSCFQSSTSLTTTPTTVTTPVTNWYLEYAPNSGGNDIILGPYSQADCQSQSVYGLGTVTKQCFQSDTSPIPTSTTKSAPANTKYQLLAPLPQLCPTGGSTPCTVDTAGRLSNYLNPMIKIFIALCAVLSVVMIVIGGLEYMTSELITSKEEGKKRIGEALFGLIIALGAWALLFTINPDLLNSDVNIPNATPGAAVTTAVLGKCNVLGLDSSLQTKIIFQGQTTEADCNAKAQPNGAATPHWTANTPAVTPSS